MEKKYEFQARIISVKPFLRSTQSVILGGIYIKFGYENQSILPPFYSFEVAS